MESLVFITPAWGRATLTRICLTQRRWLCDQLRSHGLDATCVVVADDENLDTARELGLATCEVDNENLAKRFNAGYEFAAREGIDYVFPLGSDAWLDPVYFDVELPGENDLVLSRAYNLITRTATRRGALWITWEGGVGWITRTSAWSHVGFRPVEDGLRRGCDTSTWKRKKSDLRIRENHHHQLEYVSFQSAENQITRYGHIMDTYGVGEVDGEAVFDDLLAHFRYEDVERIRRFYAWEQVAAAERLVAARRDHVNLLKQQLADAEAELAQTTAFAVAVGEPLR